MYYYLPVEIWLDINKHFKIMSQLYLSGWWYMVFKHPLAIKCGYYNMFDQEPNIWSIGPKLDRPEDINDLLWTVPYNNEKYAFVFYPYSQGTRYQEMIAEHGFSLVQNSDHLILLSN